MPNIDSAKKRVRQDKMRRARNRWRKRQIKDQVKSFMSALQSRDIPKAEEEFRKTCSVLDSVATKGTIHRNNAARHKSRLHRRLKDLQQSA